jgi:hypothetical protein
MKYTSGINDFEKALSLDKKQETRLKNAIQKAYDQVWTDSPNIDEINFIVAPYIKTPEEGFYVASVILSDVFGAMQNLGK